MNKKETEAIDQLTSLISSFKESCTSLISSFNGRLQALEVKTDKKYEPINLEKQILSSATNGIEAAIKSTLVGYNNPLNNLVLSVVNDNSSFLRQIISDSFTEVIRKEEFKQSIINAFSHKVARTIISNNDRLFDKVSNELKQDQIFKSKMTLAVAAVVNECLEERKNND